MGSPVAIRSCPNARMQPCRESGPGDRPTLLASGCLMGADIEYGTYPRARYGSVGTFQPATSEIANRVWPCACLQG